MTIKVKVCGLTDESEIKKIEKLNVDRIGFINIQRSKRYVTTEKIAYFQKQLINRRLATLVLEPDNGYAVSQAVNTTQIYNIQLHSLNNYDIRYIKWSNQFNNNGYLNTTKVIGLTDKITPEKINEIKSYSLYSDNILLDYVKDGLTGGTNTQIPIDVAIEASKIIKQENINTKVILAGGLNREYLENIYDKLEYFDMIDLNSGVEDAPGRKNIQEIKKILKLVK